VIKVLKNITAFTLNSVRNVAEQKGFRLLIRQLEDISWSFLSSLKLLTYGKVLVVKCTS